jgi:hypothetical protein
VLNDGPVTHIDLFALDKRWNRDNDGKIRNLTFEIVRHGDYRPVFVANQDNLGGAIEKAGVGTSNVETAKSLCACRDDDRQRRCDNRYQDSHAFTPLI